MSDSPSPKKINSPVDDANSYKSESLDLTTLDCVSCEMTLNVIGRKTDAWLTLKDIFKCCQSN